MEIVLIQKALCSGVNICILLILKRLAVVRLGATGQIGADLQIISDTGMRSWFRDQFIEQLNTQKLGGFDPYMDEYVLSTNK